MDFPDGKGAKALYDDQIGHVIDEGEVLAIEVIHGNSTVGATMGSVVVNVFTRGGDG